MTQKHAHPHIHKHANAIQKTLNHINGCQDSEIQIKMGGPTRFQISCTIARLKQFAISLISTSETWYVTEKTNT